MVHGFLSSAPHKNVFIIVSLQVFFIMNIALGCAGHCLSVCGQRGIAPREIALCILGGSGRRAWGLGMGG